MSDAATAPQGARPAPPAAGETNRVHELRVSGNLMTLDTGLYCILNKPSPAADAGTGLPGIRLSLPPGAASRPEAVEISTFRKDGWMSGFGDAALVRVHDGPAHVVVTIYQAPNATTGAPDIQVVKLLDSAAPLHAAAAMAAPVAAAAPPAHGPKVMDMVAHIQERGDIGALLGERLGEPGSKRWIEGFAIAPTRDIAPADVEYQAVLGRGWLSPWVEGGEFCGSRGMALPVLGLRLRLRGAAARDYECSYSATFTDGSQAGPVPAGASCEAESLAPLESFQIMVHRRGQPPVAAAPPAVHVAPFATATAPEPDREPAPARRRAAPSAKPAPAPAKAAPPAKPAPKVAAPARGKAAPPAKPAGRGAPGPRRR